MNLVIFTPGLIKSAIGRMTCLVVQALVKNGHVVTIVRTEASFLLKDAAHSFPCEVVAWTDKVLVNKAADKADALIYQVGNNFEYHCGCLDWLPKLPGLVCLHDYFLGHLFIGWAKEHSTDEVAEVLERLYDKKYEQYFCHSDSVSFIQGTCKSMPMTEWIASMSAGVIVHSAWDRERLDSACAGPVTVVPLAYEKPRQYQEQVKDSPADELIIITVGHVNPNKRAQSVIKAIGQSDDLKNKVVYRLVGAVEQDFAGELLALAKELGVRLVIRGEVDDETLAHELANADVACCLRWPTLEAASASTIEAMLCGKATVVTDTGFYSELPDDCVLKISPEKEVGDIKNALVKLSSDVIFRRQLGESAAYYAAEYFSPQGYADALIEMSRLVNQCTISRQAFLNLNAILAGWSEKKPSLKLSLEDSEKIRNVFAVGYDEQRGAVAPNNYFRSIVGRYFIKLINKLYRAVASRPKLFFLMKKLIRKNLGIRQLTVKILSFPTPMTIVKNHQGMEVRYQKEQKGTAV
jgi:glycosyltransferase involved in cell wall biosynthesis